MSKIYDINGKEIIAGGVKLGYDSFIIPQNGIKRKDLATPSSVSLAKWDIPTQPDTWANSTWNAIQFVQNLYDPFITTYVDNYTVTKRKLGDDEGYDIFEFSFVPENYTRTILLSGGMHAREIAAHFSLARFMHYVVNDPDASEITRYVHDNVRVFLIPLLDAPGFSMTPRRFGTSTGTNQNGNFTWIDDDGNNAWDYFDNSEPYPTGWMYKGTEPFSEKQTRILRDWLQTHQYQAEFWIDCHTGTGWDQDVWYYYIDEDPIFAPKIKALEPWLSEKFAAKRGIPVSELKNLVQDRWTSYKLRYAVKQLGIPCSTIELVSTRFGGAESGSNAIQMYLYQLANIIGAGLSTTNLDDEWRRLSEMKSLSTARRIAVALAN